MERRFNSRMPLKENKVKLEASCRQGQAAPAERAPDLSDFMNDWFFGAATADQKKSYNLNGGDYCRNIENSVEEDGRDHPHHQKGSAAAAAAAYEEEDVISYEPPRMSTSSKLTQEWLEEARRMVAMSPGRHESPSRLVGSPRFAAARGSESPAIDRRDPLSRSARRFRQAEGFSGEILTKSAKQSRHRSEEIQTQTTDKFHPSSVHSWFSNILGLDPKQQQQQQQQHKPPQDQQQPPHQNPAAADHFLPPRLPVHRKSRFQEEAGDAETAAKPVPPRRSSRTSSASAPEDLQVLSPPKHLIESAHRRTISSSTCSLNKLSRPDADSRKSVSKTGGVEEAKAGIGRLNSFLEEQRAKVRRICSGETSTKATIILSKSHNSTSSMVAAICYAWLWRNKDDGDAGWTTVVPVMNMHRENMWKQKQAAWFFQHVGIDVTALLFSNEVDLESLVMANQLSILVVGQDVLKTNGEVGSECTILTDNYCEDAYELLQMPYLKMLLLAGILLDTQNLNAASKFSSNKDTEAVQLLLVGSDPNIRFTLYEQLMQDQKDESFLETLQRNYGKPTKESGDENEEPVERKVTGRISSSLPHQDINPKTSDMTQANMKSTRISEASPNQGKKKPSTVTAPSTTTAEAAEPIQRGKNKSFLAKLFGFGSKK